MADQDLQAETRKIAMTTTPQEENFVRGSRFVYLISDADCYVDFDQTADTGSLLCKANVPTNPLPVTCTKISARTVSSTGNLYILFMR